MRLHSLSSNQAEIPFSMFWMPFATSKISKLRFRLGYWEQFRSLILTFFLKFAKRFSLIKPCRPGPALRRAGAQRKAHLRGSQSREFFGENGVVRGRFEDLLMSIVVYCCLLMSNYIVYWCILMSNYIGLLMYIECLIKLSILSIVIRWFKESLSMDPFFPQFWHPNAMVDEQPWEPRRMPSNIFLVPSYRVDRWPVRCVFLGTCWKVRYSWPILAHTILIQGSQRFDARNEWRPAVDAVVSFPAGWLKNRGGPLNVLKQSTGKWWY